MSQVTLSRDLTAADVGTGSFDIVATTADGQFNSTQTITYTIALPAPAEGPPVFSGWATAVNLTTDMKAGAVVATGSLTDSDGTPFNGTATVSNPLFSFTP